MGSLNGRINVGISRASYSQKAIVENVHDYVADKAHMWTPLQIVAGKALLGTVHFCGEMWCGVARYPEEARAVALSDLPRLANDWTILGIGLLLDSSYALKLPTLTEWKSANHGIKPKHDNLLKHQYPNP